MNDSNINFNVDLLVNLVNKHSTLNEEFFKEHAIRPVEKKILEKLVVFAATKALGEINPYIEDGSKRIDPSKVAAIEKNIENLKKKLGQSLASQSQRLSKKAHKLMVFLDTIRNDKLYQENNDMKTRMDDYAQIMGCIVSYCNWKEGDIVLGPCAGETNFVVHKVIQNKKGLQLVVLVPEDKNSNFSPIICCRGTVEDNKHNYLDDLNKHIGQLAFQASRNEILSVLKEVSGEYKKSMIVTGHSLGGAISQIIAAEFCDQLNEINQPLLKSVYFFNAPGVGEAVAKQYSDKCAAIPVEQRPCVINYHHAYDIVNLAGGAHIKADYTFVIDRFEFGKIRNAADLRLNHAFRELVSKSPRHRIKGDYPIARQILRKISEIIRRLFALIASLFLKTMIHKSESHRVQARKLYRYLKPKLNKSTDLGVVV